MRNVSTDSQLLSRSADERVIRSFNLILSSIVLTCCSARSTYPVAVTGSCIVILMR